MKTKMEEAMNLTIFPVMILSDPKSNHDSSSNDEYVGGLPADASTLKSRDFKESWSIAPVSSNQGRTGARNVICENSGPPKHASTLCLSAFDCFFLFFRKNFYLFK